MYAAVRACLVVDRGNSAQIGPDATPVNMVVYDNIYLWAKGVQLDVQANGRGDIPVALNDIAAAIEGNDARGRQFAPGQLLGVGENVTIGEAIGNVPGDPALGRNAPPLPD